MAWLTDQEFIDFYVAGSVHEVPPAQIGECLDSAKAEILRVCGNINTEIENGDGDELKLSTVRRAQRKLAYAEFLDLATSRMRSGGVMLKERDENNSTLNEYESVNDVLKRKANLRNEALQSLEPYYTPAEVIETQDFYSSSVPIEISW